MASHQCSIFSAYLILLICPVKNGGITKQLLGGSLTLRDYDGQVAEAMAMVRALNKMTKAGMPESVRIA